MLRLFSRFGLSLTKEMRRNFSSNPGQQDGLRIGYVPEHFSTPLNFTQKHYGLDADLIPYPSGTGHMIQSLQSSSIDIGIGLTEAWIAGLAKAKAQGETGAYKLVGQYVKSPLCWAISTGAKRDVNVQQLRGKKVGVSRIGSGSYVMPFVLADRNGWLEKPGQNPFEPVILSTFEKLREAVNSGDADFFMWEHFTSKRYYDNGEIKRIGEIYTPWSSWHIVAREPSNPKVADMLERINLGINHFRSGQEEAVEYISQNLDYSADDAREWLKTVQFSDDASRLNMAEIDKTIEILGKAGVLEAGKVSSSEMVL